METVMNHLTRVVLTSWLTFMTSYNWRSRKFRSSNRHLLFTITKWRNSTVGVGYREYEGQKFTTGWLWRVLTVQLAARLTKNFAGFYVLRYWLFNISPGHQNFNSRPTRSPSIDSIYDNSEAAIFQWLLFQGLHCGKRWSPVHSGFKIYTCVHRRHCIVSPLQQKQT